MLFGVGLLLLSASLTAQERDTSYWKGQGTFGINLSQVSLTNWAAGGDGSVAGDVSATYSLDYKRDKQLWQNRLELSYGLNNTQTNGTRKTNDKIYLNSMYGYQLAEQWYLTAFINYQSQFDKGYDYKVSGTDFISRFMSPGYLSTGLGATWTPRPWFTATLSPASWRGTFVMSDYLSAKGAFGVTPGEHLLSEFGSNLTMEAKTEFLPNMTVYTRLALFSNYLDKPQNVDVRWDTQLTMKINDWFSANLNLNMIYDDDVKFERADGSRIARLQFKEVLGVGFMATF
ncbi:MAG: DUF3078 domain-containing protein [Rikenellaceae bacterium]|nr:DUF3078 domain-containing protein [Rikenellaceae bacterium]